MKDRMQLNSHPINARARKILKAAKIPWSKGTMLPVELAQSIPSPRLRLRLSKAALSQLLRYLQTHPELTETLAGSSDGSPSDATH